MQQAEAGIEGAGAPGIDTVEAAPGMLGAADRGLGHGLSTLNAAGTCIILFLTLMTDAEVILRKLSDVPGLNDATIALQRWLTADPDLTYYTAPFRFGPLEGVLELSELSIVAIVFLQLGYAVRSGKMVRSDGLTSVLSRNAPRTGHGLMLVYNLLGIAFFAAIIAGGYSIFEQHWQQGLWIGTAGLFAAPTWPVKLAVLVGSAAVILQLAMFSVRHARALTLRR